MMKSLAKSLLSVILQRFDTSAMSIQGERSGVKSTSKLVTGGKGKRMEKEVFYQRDGMGSGTMVRK